MPSITRAQARRVRLVGLDVDGTMTDGGVYLGAVSANGRPQAVELKRYDIQDGLGVVFLRSCGIKVVIVTRRTSDSVRMRAEELGVDAFAQDTKLQKLVMWQRILSEQGVEARDTAFIGDDIPDLAIMRDTGLAVAVANAVPEIKREADVVLRREGGRGAVREFTELLLKARGEWKACLDRYLDVSPRARVTA